MRVCPRLRPKGVCACGLPQVSNIRLRPPPQVDIRAAWSRNGVSPFRKGGAMPTTRKRKNRPLQGAAARPALAAALAFLISVPGHSQVAEDNRTALAQIGFTAKDFAASATTQISPHFSFYKTWRDCFRSATDAFLSAGKSADDATTFAKATCQDESLALRASIAKPLGLAEANRVIDLLVSDFAITLRRSWDRSNAALPQGTRIVGNWRIVPGEAGACAAVGVFGGIDQPVRLLKNRNGFFLLLKTDRPQPATGSMSTDKVIIGHYPNPTQITSSFEVVRAQDQTWLAGKLSDEDIRFLTISGSITLKDKNSTSVWNQGGDGYITLDPTFRDAVSAVAQC